MDYVVRNGHKIGLNPKFANSVALFSLWGAICATHLFPPLMIIFV